MLMPVAAGHDSDGVSRRPVTVFIGSSSESVWVAEAMRTALERDRPELHVEVWRSGGVFEVSEMSLDSLYQTATRSDFAILVAAEDDDVIKRGVSGAAPRDNVIFELGLFMGVISRSRVMLLRPENQNIILPSDIDGWTRLRGYREPRGETHHAAEQAVNAAARQAADRIRELGARTRDGGTPASKPDAPVVDQYATFDAKCASLVGIAESQGWRVRLERQRLRAWDRRGRKFSAPINEAGGPILAEAELLRFCSTLRVHGLRVGNRFRRPSPWQAVARAREDGLSPR